MTPKPKFGDLIRAMREGKGWTIKELIEKLDDSVSSSYITKIELHGEIPSPMLIEKLADAFGCNAKAKQSLRVCAINCKIEQYQESMHEKYKEPK